MSLWHGGLFSNTCTLVLVSIADSLLSNGPVYIFEGIFGNLDAVHATHKVTRFGIGHHQIPIGLMDMTTHTK